MSYFNLDSTTHLYYEVSGSGHPLVLIHGFSLDTRMWDDQFETFARHYQVVRYDCRGFGKSALPINDDYAHADDLALLLEHLGVGQAYVLGLSMGGSIAVDFVLSYPEAVDALITVDSVLGGRQWTPRYGALVNAMWRRRRELDHQAWVEEWLRFDIFDVAMEKPTVAAKLRDIISDYSGCHLTKDIGSRVRAANPPATERLGEITVPTLVIVGERDSHDFHLIADILQEGIPGARKVVFPGAGHMVNMEFPEEFNRTVLDFLQEIDETASNQAQSDKTGMVAIRRGG